MDDPELRSDETVLAEAKRLFVKSIPFEGILTNQQIILIDREKKLLPPKKIPLGNITETFCGEDRNGDPTLTLSVTAKTGVTRQIVLTFQRLIRTDPTRERDQWVKKIRRALSPMPEKGSRKPVPRPELAPDKAVSPASEPVKPSRMPPKKAISPGVSGSGTTSVPTQPPVAAPKKAVSGGTPGAGTVSVAVQQLRMPQKKAVPPGVSGSGPASVPVQPPVAAPKNDVSAGWSSAGATRVPVQPPAPAPKKAAGPASGSSAAGTPVQPPVTAPGKAPSPVSGSGTIPGPVQPPAPAPKKAATPRSLIPGIAEVPVPPRAPGPAQPPVSGGRERIHPSRKIQREIVPAPAPSPALIKKSEKFPPGALLSCPMCAHRVPAGSKFCDKCGSKIAAAP